MVSAMPAMVTPAAASMVALALFVFLFLGLFLARGWRIPGVALPRWRALRRCQKWARGQGERRDQDFRL
jgi:hypothetical protein